MPKKQNRKSHAKPTQSPHALANYEQLIELHSLKNVYDDLHVEKFTVPFAALSHIISFKFISQQMINYFITDEIFLNEKMLANFYIIFNKCTSAFNTYIEFMRQYCSLVSKSGVDVDTCMKTLPLLSNKELNTLFDADMVSTMKSSINICMDFLPKGEMKNSILLNKMNEMSIGQILNFVNFSHEELSQLTSKLAKQVDAELVKSVLRKYSPISSLNENRGLTISATTTSTTPLLSKMYTFLYLYMFNKNNFDLSWNHYQAMSEYVVDQEINKLKQMIAQETKMMDRFKLLSVLMVVFILSFEQGDNLQSFIAFNLALMLIKYSLPYIKNFNQEYIFKNKLSGTEKQLFEAIQPYGEIKVHQGNDLKNSTFTLQFEPYCDDQVDMSGAKMTNLFKTAFRLLNMDIISYNKYKISLSANISFNAMMASKLKNIISSLLENKAFQNKFDRQIQSIAAILKCKFRSSPYQEPQSQMIKQKYHLFVNGYDNHVLDKLKDLFAHEAVNLENDSIIIEPTHLISQEKIDEFSAFYAEYIQQDQAANVPPREEPGFDEEITFIVIDEADDSMTTNTIHTDAAASPLVVSANHSSLFNSAHRANVRKNQHNTKSTQHQKQDNTKDKNKVPALVPIEGSHLKRNTFFIQSALQSSDFPTKELENSFNAVIKRAKIAKNKGEQGFKFIPGGRWTRDSHGRIKKWFLAELAVKIVGPGGQFRLFADKTVNKEENKVIYTIRAFERTH